ncbi:hypothetical protein GCM10007036_27120 [Alsobacter metallidurans]|uniref:Uncharacterized protein n=1 Tax=Alsobacter metallidurans TaxID=340221 RepID=A0A917I8F0_9HYPH|nr:hypothetical protein [Alsobacter metallidurans]GGH22250.1 hypothetical protein GCM10007036_27120 [Alsobacter metallidurans]
MIKTAPPRSVSLDHVAAVAGAAFAFDEHAALAGARRRPKSDQRWVVGAAAAVVVGLAGWLARQLGA